MDIKHLAQSLPRIDPSSYTWKSSARDPTFWQRRACGVEALYGVEAHQTAGANDIFFLTTIELDKKRNPNSLRDVERAAQRAWIRLRSNHPEIACTVAFDDQKKCLLQYRVPKDDRQARIWAERTIYAEASYKPIMAVRDAWVEITGLSQICSREAVIIYIVASAAHEGETLKEGAEVELLFHSNHLFFDPIGFRAMASAFLELLAAELHTPPYFPLNLPWHQNAQKLPPASVGMLGLKEQIAGPEFDRALEEQLAMFVAMETKPGMTVRKRKNGRPKTVFHIFSEYSTKGMENDAFAGGASYTHVTQAALLLATLRLDPPVVDVLSANYTTPSKVYGRQLLSQGSDDQRDPTKTNYWLNCQCDCFINFDDIQQYVQAELDNNSEETEGVVSKAANVALEGYKHRIERDSVQLATSIPIMEITGSTRSTFTNTNPVFASDSLYTTYVSNDNLLDSGHNDPIHMGYRNYLGTLEFLVKDTAFWMNQYGPLPIIRATMWPGGVDYQRLRLSCDFNTAYHSEVKMQEYLDKIASYMMAPTLQIGKPYLEEVADINSKLREKATKIRNRKAR